MPAKYSIKEVEDRTGVAAATLRQWERRYGFPRPQRSSRGYRLFSDEDLATIIRMQALVTQGVPPSRAAQLVQQSARQEPGGRMLSALAAELSTALKSLDTAQAERTLSEAHAIHALDDVLLHVIAPALVEIGDLWHAGELSVTTEHLASQFIQNRLRLLLTLMPRVTGARRVLVACAPGELHEMGALILAVMLGREGFDVRYLGQATPLRDLVALAKDLAADALFISASLASAVEALSEESELLRSLETPVVFGGRAFADDPDKARKLGGVFLGNDLVEAMLAVAAKIGKGAQ